MRGIGIGLSLALFLPTLAQAQEVIVTAQRRTEAVPETSGVGIRRHADFVVQRITIYGDTRDKDQRRKEILATVRNAIEFGQKRGIEASYGAAVIQPLTIANYADKLSFDKDEDRDDAEQVSFVI